MALKVGLVGLQNQINPNTQTISNLTGFNSDQDPGYTTTSTINFKMKHRVRGIYPPSGIQIKIKLRDRLLKKQKIEASFMKIRNKC